MRKYEKCVLAVKKKQPKSCEKKKWKGIGCINPWAVCTKSVGRPPVRRSARRSKSRRVGRSPLKRSKSRRVGRSPLKRSNSRRVGRPPIRRSRRS